MNQLHSLRHFSAGTLPPSFTQPMHSHHHHRNQAPSWRYGADHPATHRSTSNLTTAPKVLLPVNYPTARGGGSTPLPPQNDGLRPSSVISAHSNNVFSRKRPRTSPYPHTRHTNDETNDSLPSDSQLGSPDSTTVAFPVGAGGGDGGGRGSLWGSTGLPPTEAVHPGSGTLRHETEWACPTSSIATSTPSLHDGFSDVSKTGCSIIWGTSRDKEAG